MKSPHLQCLSEIEDGVFFCNLKNSNTQIIKHKSPYPIVIPTIIMLLVCTSFVIPTFDYIYIFSFCVCRFR